MSYLKCSLLKKPPLISQAVTLPVFPLQFQDSALIICHEVSAGDSILAVTFYKQLQLAVLRIVFREYVSVNRQRNLLKWNWLAKKSTNNTIVTIFYQIFLITNFWSNRNIDKISTYTKALDIFHFRTFYWYALQKLVCMK